MINYIFIGCCIVYIIRVIVVFIGARKCRKKQKQTIIINDNNIKKLPFVSIIVPAKDEEDNIENCLNALINSNYPKESYEIICVNDRSVDNTSSIISEFSRKHKNINIVQKNITNPNNLRNLQGKPGAIHAGISIAKGELFLLTDADCIVEKNWIMTIVSNFLNDDQSINRNIGMVCSYTNIQGKNIFGKFQDSEWTYMSTCACAGIGFNKVIGCFGNNLAISREAYYTVGGYPNIKFSITEDYSLLKTVYNAGYKINYLCDKEACVETLPVNNLKEYFRQHKRWALGGMSLGWVAAAYVFSVCCITATFLISVLQMNILLFLIHIFLRILGDMLVLFPVYNILEKKYLRKWVIPFIGVFSIVEVLIPFTLLNRKVIWKNQVFNIKS